jgi:hypothetical protein
LIDREGEKQMAREQLLAEVTRKYEDTYRRRTKKSSETLAKARK